MSRKAIIPASDVTPDLLRSREKRKWQIALRRYVLEKKASAEYAPYFGLDIASLREWFEMQFEPGIGWGDFAHQWQFDHIIPVTHFDFSDDLELKMCWNFTNLRVSPLATHKGSGYQSDLLAAKNYFENLHRATQYKPCLALLEKIEKLNHPELLNLDKQQAFITKHRPYLDILENYSSFEFGLLNSGRTIDEVTKEVAFLKKF